MAHTDRLGWLTLAAVAVALTVSLIAPSMTSAHERRKIAGDKAEVVVGWIVEPAYVEEPNGVDFRAMKAGTTDPIEGLEKTVKVEVTKGGVTKTYDLKTRFGMKGAYTADIVPTATGDYTFRFTGEIEGAKIDEKFESGPGRFNAILPLTATQFPAPLPSTAELQSQVAAATAAANSARTIGVVGLAVGVVGLIAAAVALLRRRGGAGRRDTAAISRRPRLYLGRRGRGAPPASPPPARASGSARPGGPLPSGVTRPCRRPPPLLALIRSCCWRCSRWPRRSPRTPTGARRAGDRTRCCRPAAGDDNSGSPRRSSPPSPRSSCSTPTPAGRHHQRRGSSADRLLTLDLPPLPDGAYTVTWKTTSAVDGHAARGFYGLAIGQPAATPAPPAPVPASRGAAGPVQAAVRWLAFAGQALLVGGLLFGPARPGPGAGRRRRRRRPARRTDRPAVGGCAWSTRWRWRPSACAALARCS